MRTTQLTISKNEHATTKGSVILVYFMNELSKLSTFLIIVAEGNDVAYLDVSPMAYVASRCMYDTALQQASLLLSFFTGSILRDNIATLERALFRETIENCLVRFADVRKRAFMFLFSSAAVKTKAATIFDAFDTYRYYITEDQTDQMTPLGRFCKTHVNYLRKIIYISNEHKKTFYAMAINNCCPIVNMCSAKWEFSTL